MSFYEYLGTPKAPDMERASAIIEERIRELFGTEEADLYSSMPGSLSILGIWATGKSVGLSKELLGEEAVTPEGAKLAYVSVQYALGMLTELAKWLDVEAALSDGAKPPQRWLAELDGEELIALFRGQTPPETDAVVIQDLQQDLQDAYPGSMEFIRHLMVDFFGSNTAEEFGGGVMAGATLMLQALRLKAEKDALGRGEPTDPPPNPS